MQGRSREQSDLEYGHNCYLLAVGSSIASVLMQPRNMVSLGASGAVFGMFAVSVLTKLQFRPRKLLEFAILGQFVIQQLSNVGFANLLFRLPGHSHLTAAKQCIPMHIGNLFEDKTT